MTDLLQSFFDYLINIDIYYSLSALFLFAVLIYERREGLFTGRGMYTIMFSTLFCVFCAIVSWVAVKVLPLLLFIYYKPFLGLYSKDKKLKPEDNESTN